MRIVIDLQGAQSNSKERGIGRYSMALTTQLIQLCQQYKHHEIVVVLSAAFPSTLQPIRKQLASLLPQDQIRIFYPMIPCQIVDPNNHWRVEASRALYTAFMTQLNPDIILITSLFEGHIDHACSYLTPFFQKIPTAVILYDLIPLLHQNIYLTDESQCHWYQQKTQELQSATHILAISENTKEEVATAQLNIKPEQITNISGAGNDYFKPLKISETLRTTILSRYSITHDFLLYTGGIDTRKNMDGLIRSYAKLPKIVRSKHQLVIVCSIRPKDRERLLHLAKQHQLTQHDVILTGYIQDHDLRILYNLCKAFVFPSWHEGFGLPILEAMQCGAAVIGSNQSSIPEVIGFENALFDPYNDESIANKIETVLCDDSFRNTLIQQGEQQVQQFSWLKTAEKTLIALEETVLHFQQNQIDQEIVRITHSLENPKPKLAYVSPLPPSQSGIAYYSSKLIPELAIHYDLELIVQDDAFTSPKRESYGHLRSISWFIEHAQTYDRVLYHVGNAVDNAAIFDLIHHIPGVLVLHDFYLGEILSHLEIMNPKAKPWSLALFNAHGYSALVKRMHATNHTSIISQYPCNQSLIKPALGVIVHIKECLNLGNQWLGTNKRQPWFHIPPLQHLPAVMNQKTAREQLFFDEEAFIVCSFGTLSSNNLSIQLLNAWLDSDLHHHAKNQLVFIGEADDSYGQQVKKLIQEHQAEERVHITGWMDEQTFHQYLAAASLAVQLKTGARGETASALINCLAHGLTSIVNAHGCMAELPKDTVYMLSDHFTHAELVEALNDLYHHQEKREAYAIEGRSYIQTFHNPTRCAKNYFNAIEHSYHLKKSNPVEHLIREIARISPTATPRDTLKIAEIITLNHAHSTQRRFFIDISHWLRLTHLEPEEEAWVYELINHPPNDYRVEPVYLTKSGLRYATQQILKWLKCKMLHLKNQKIQPQQGDYYFSWKRVKPNSFHEKIQNFFINHGVLVYQIESMGSDSIDSKNQSSLTPLNLPPLKPGKHWVLHPNCVVDDSEQLPHHQVQEPE